MDFWDFYFVIFFALLLLFEIKLDVFFAINADTVVISVVKVFIEKN